MAFKIAQSPWTLPAFGPVVFTRHLFFVCFLFFRVYGLFYFFIFFFVETVKRGVLSEALRCRKTR